MASWRGLGFGFPLPSRFTVAMIGTGSKVKGVRADLMPDAVTQTEFRRMTCWRWASQAPEEAGRDAGTPVTDGCGHNERIVSLEISQRNYKLFSFRYVTLGVLLTRQLRADAKKIFTHKSPKEEFNNVRY
jgi:hypothetical protein